MEVLKNIKRKLGEFSSWPFKYPKKHIYSFEHFLLQDRALDTLLLPFLDDSDMFALKSTSLKLYKKIKSFYIFGKECIRLQRAKKGYFKMIPFQCKCLGDYKFSIPFDDEHFLAQTKMIPQHYYKNVLCGRIARMGNLQLIKWVKNNSSSNFYFGSDVFGEATGSGNIKLLEYLVEEGCCFNNSYCKITNLEVLIFLKKIGYCIDSCHFFSAVWRQDLEILKFLIENYPIEYTNLDGYTSAFVLRCLLEKGFMIKKIHNENYKLEKIQI